MNQYIFLLGRASDLCFEELKSVLKEKDIKPSRISDSFAIISSNTVKPDNLINVLGGTVKIGKVISTNPENTIQEITNDLATNKKRLTFSVFDMEPAEHKKIKSSLKKNDISSRYTFLKNIFQTATSQQKNYHEYWVLNIKDKEYIVKALSFQNIKQWSRRDYRRPESDPRSGMLPPKVARMMVNLAVSPYKKSTIYDPFCGSGTILSEAMMLGHDVIGSDISKDAIRDSEKNLKWVKQTYSLESNYKLFTKEVAHVTKKDLGKKIDAIVYEPFMGPPVIKSKKIKNIVKGLNKLYIGAINNCSDLLDSGKKLALIFPEFRFNNFSKSTDNLIDRRENFGYTRQAGPLIYDRPDSTVVRRIYILVKK